MQILSTIRKSLNRVSLSSAKVKQWSVTAHESSGADYWQLSSLGDQNNNCNWSMIHVDDDPIQQKLLTSAAFAFHQMEDIWPDADTEIRWPLIASYKLFGIFTSNVSTLTSIAQFTITINSNVCPHIRVLNTLMRESYAWHHRNTLFPEHSRQLYHINYGYF